MSIHDTPIGSLARVRKDLLPEYAPPRDKGCEVSPSCLDCPLAVCRYDAHGRNWRNSAIRRQRRSGVKVQEIADHFGLSARTVHRVLVSEPVKPPKIEDGHLLAVKDLRPRRWYKQRAPLPTILVAGG